jgi:hypothetical protein
MVSRAPIRARASAGVRDARRETHDVRDDDDDDEIYRHLERVRAATRGTRRRRDADEHGATSARAGGP